MTRQYEAFWLVCTSL